MAFRIDPATSESPLIVFPGGTVGGDKTVMDSVQARFVEHASGQLDVSLGLFEIRPSMNNCAVTEQWGMPVDITRPEYIDASRILMTMADGSTRIW